MPDVNLMWIGNRAMLDSSPSTNISQNQANAIIGWEAEGRDEIAPVMLNGNSYGSGTQAQFRTTYNATRQQPASQFTYNDPLTGEPQSGVEIVSFLRTTFDITVHAQDGTPSVMQQQGVLVRSAIAQMMFGVSEVLVAAKQLLQLEGIDIADDLAEVEYFHFIFDRHEIVWSNGAETESLYPGAEAMKAVGRAARDELFALFPQLRTPDFKADAARPLLSGRQGRRLAVRHVQNDKPLLAA